MLHFDSEGLMQDTISKHVSGNSAPRDFHFPFFLKSGNYVIRGKVRWISDDVAYVLVPYGTAMASRQRWEAIFDAPGRPCDSGIERRVSVQLIAASQCMDEDDEMEGLLLRLLDPRILTFSSSSPSQVERTSHEPDWANSVE